MPQNKQTVWVIMHYEYNERRDGMRRLRKARRIPIRR